MKQILYIIFLITGVISCNSKTSNKSALPINLKSSLDTTEVVNIIEDEIIVPDTITKKSDLKLGEITADDFEKYKKANKSKCEIDENGFIQGYGLKVETECEQICESYLIDRKAKKKMFLPSSFDQGIIGMRFSPSCNQFFVFSSYDGPDYVNYYTHRAELIVFTMKPGAGLKSVKQYQPHDFDDFSIEDATWIDEKTLALKVYEGAAGGDNSHLNFKYYKAEF